LVEIYSNDRKAADGVVTLSFERTASERIGPCTYRVWIVRETMEASRGPKTGFLKFYAPDLGLVLRTIRLDADGNPISEVRYDRIGVVGGK
ncbi:MAG TPA: hypothetical protein VK862_12170, partial [Afifellaceae bacterium]|nr:hypothetical protein [Afifellaceae bacterium]